MINNSNDIRLKKNQLNRIRHSKFGRLSILLIFIIFGCDPDGCCNGSVEVQVPINGIVSQAAYNAIDIVACNAANN